MTLNKRDNAANEYTCNCNKQPHMDKYFQSAALKWIQVTDNQADYSFVFEKYNIDLIISFVCFYFHKIQKFCDFFCTKLVEILLMLEGNLIWD